MARARKKVSLASMSWDATPERMLKAANDNEIVVSANDNGAPVQTRRLTDWPIACLHARRHLDPDPDANDVMREAAERYEADFHAAGMVPLAAIDYGRVRVDCARAGTGDFRHGAKDRHQHAAKALGALARVVDAVVLREEKIVAVGLDVLGPVSVERARDHAINALRDGLRLLADHYGIWRRLAAA